jgi:DNA/RNA-binding domain of Phe-tRNA-synthetase-like protein
MSFVVAEECLALGLRAGAAVLRNVRVEAESTELSTQVASAVAAIRGRLSDSHAVWSLPEVVGFQEVLRKVGVNPRREQPSVGRLLTFALQRGTLPAINNLVDAYNLVSARTLCSLGAHDLDQIALPVTLRLLSGAESFTPLGSDQAVVVAAGEFGYVDAAGRVLCRLDIRQADFSKVTPATRNALLIVEGTPAHPVELLRQALDEAVALVTRHCGGTAEIVALP